MEIDIGNC